MTERDALTFLLSQGYQWVWSGAQRVDLTAYQAELQGDGWAEISLDYGHSSCRLWGLSPDKTSTLLYRVCKDRHPV